MLSAHDVARELRQRLPQAGDLRIHKLAYYCQGWHVAWTGRPMFPQDIEAWANGPVVADLWHDEHRNRRPPLPQVPDESQLAVIEYVIGRYGSFSGKELARRTHLEDPWRDVSESEGEWGVANPTITQDALGAWFGQDEDYVAHRDEVTRLRERRDLYGLDGPAMPDDLREATLRIVTDRGHPLAAL